ncbi:MAG: hypothetical protein D6753_16200 [Planctomycetota bacterium]|nr:MAG: hypothetical protein D6753_16200 [Planctomycetota bacterium]
MNIESVNRCNVCRCYLDVDDLFCANCGTENPLHSSQQDTPPAAERVISFDCQGCGASMRYDAEAQALRCPFCGSTRIVQQPPRAHIAPQWAAPARVDRHHAEQILREWLKTGFWRPSDAATSSTIAEMRGVYVPFWNFRARTDTKWTADASPPPAGCRGNWYPVSGRFQSTYESVLIPGSSALTLAEGQAIGPFQLANLVPIDQCDMRGWIVETLKRPRKAVRPIVRAEIERLEAQRAASRLPGRHRNLHVNVRIEELFGTPVLLPVWILAYRYRGQVRRVLINAQTGKISGIAPFSYKKLAMVILVVLAVIIGLLALVAMNS